MAITSRNRSPEFLADLMDHAVDIIESQSTLSKQEAVDLATQVVDRMRQHWGGLQIYFPKGVGRAADSRNIRISDEFDGTNHHQLAKKYQVSLTVVYEAIRQLRAARRR